MMTCHRPHPPPSPSSSPPRSIVRSVGRSSGCCLSHFCTFPLILSNQPTQRADRKRARWNIMNRKTPRSSFQTTSAGPSHNPEYPTVDSMLESPFPFPMIPARTQKKGERLARSLFSQLFLCAVINERRRGQELRCYACR